MEQLLNEFAKYDQKSRNIILDYIIKKHELFFIALQTCTIPKIINNELPADKIVQLIEENPKNIDEILCRCESNSFLRNLELLKQCRHPIINEVRFVKTRDLNHFDENRSDQFLIFLYPKCRVWLFFKYNILWCVIKNKDIERKKHIYQFFSAQFNGKLSNNLHVMEVCYETRKTDEIISYCVLDVIYYNNTSLMAKSFEYRYDYLKELGFLPIMTPISKVNKTDKYLLKKRGDNVYDRTDWTLNLTRLQMSKFLLIGETEINNRTKVYVAKLDIFQNKFIVIGVIGKSELLKSCQIVNNIELTGNGLCVFKSEYTWKYPKPTHINYYKMPIGAEIVLMSKKLNMRSPIQSLVYPAPTTRTYYTKIY